MHEHLINLVHALGESAALHGLAAPYRRESWAATLAASTDEDLIMLIMLYGEAYGFGETFARAAFLRPGDIIIGLDGHPEGVVEAKRIRPADERASGELEMLVTYTGMDPHPEIARWELAVLRPYVDEN